MYSSFPRNICLFLSLLFVSVKPRSCFKIRTNCKLVNTFRLFKDCNDRTNCLYEPSDETIYGLSSSIPEGGCGVAVVRLSGPDSLHVLQLLTKKSVDLNPREAKLFKLYSLIDGDVIDSVLAIYFKAPKSYTGDDVVEFHTHGSTAVVSELFDNFRHISTYYNTKLRQAEKGEFTRRAFYSGKMNLTQVEGIRELISSTNYVQKKNSIHKVNNCLFKLYNKWMDQLTEVAGVVEGTIDFQEESSSDIILKDSSLIRDMLKNLLLDIKSYLNNKKEIILDGIKVLLIGPPNSGKSSFINKIFDDEISIVSDIPGTTRDLIRVNYKLNDLNFQIVDTAGLRNIKSDTSNDNEKIELLGINKALNEIKDVNVTIFLFDPLNLDDSLFSLDQLFSNLVHHEGGTDYDSPGPESDKLLYICISKADLVDDENKYREIINERLAKLMESNAAAKDLVEGVRVMTTCNLDRDNVKQIMNAVDSDVKKRFNIDNNTLFINNQRHKSHLNRVVQFITSTIGLIDGGKIDLEIISEYLRNCTYELEFIIGERTNDSILNHIFNTFCVGK